MEHLHQNITKTTATQVRHPAPGPRRRIAVVAIAAITLIPGTVLVSRLSARGSGPPPVDFAEAPPGVAVAAEIEYAPTPTTMPSASQPSAANCGLTCAPEVAALWQHTVSASVSESDAQIAALAESIRATLRAIDDAVVAAAPAFR